MFQEQMRGKVMFNIGNIVNGFLEATNPKCPKCLKTLEVEDKFCIHCGYEFSDEDVRAFSKYREQSKVSSFYAVVIFILFMIFIAFIFKFLGY